MHIARTLTGSTTQDEGQERREAKTQIVRRQTSGDASKRKWKQHGMFQLREKQGVLIITGMVGTSLCQSQEKRRQITCRLFLLAFRCDSASPLY